MPCASGELRGEDAIAATYIQRLLARNRHALEQQAVVVQVVVPGFCHDRAQGMRFIGVGPAIRAQMVLAGELHSATRAQLASEPGTESSGGQRTTPPRPRSRHEQPGRARRGSGRSECGIEGLAAHLLSSRRVASVMVRARSAARPRRARFLRSSPGHTNIAPKRSNVNMPSRTGISPAGSFSCLA